MAETMFEAIKEKIQESTHNYLFDPLTKDQIKTISKNISNTLWELTKDDCAKVINIEPDREDLDRLVVTIQGPAWFIAMMSGLQGEYTDVVSKN